MRFKKLNNILGWGVFAIAAIVYLSTMERELSFWDCGEYIVSSAKLGVTHAPGAATFQLLGAVWAGLAMGNGALYAVFINSLSALSSAFTILFMFWTITHLTRRIVTKNITEELSGSNLWVVLVSGVVGALAFTFSDSFWFSAVEGEVYAMASCFTALMLWLACKWENDAGKPRENKWLILIALLIGLSTGVHLMAILVVPAICYLYYFRHYNFSWKSFIVANIVTLLIFVFVFKIIFSYTMTFYGKLEIFMVNEMGMPFNSGSVVATIIILAVFGLALYYTKNKGYTLANTAVLATFFMLIGFSTWLVIPIRANANPHMNLNDPEDAIGLLSYFNRDQYGDWPVFYGPLYTAHEDSNGVERNPDGSVVMVDKGPIYKKNKKKGTYEIVGRKQDVVYNKEHMGLFARMYNPATIKNYEAIMGPAETYKSYNAETGREEVHYKPPTLMQNIQFFLGYQIGYMYLRYLGWNFMGRQNDYEGNLEVTKGNAITGINFIDNFLVGGQTNLPTKFKENKARNVYFGIPLLLGLIGFLFQLKKDWGRTFALVSLFLLTGVGIILYTNVKPFEPRERDYAVVTSFYVFAIWIGLSVPAIYSFLKEKLTPKVSLIISGLTLVAPLLMGFQNWDDHTRKERRAAHDLAYDYLVNLDKDAILFVYGDNDTYPLWGLQETADFRLDVKVVNYTLLGSPWNISQVKRKTYDAMPLPSQMQEDDYRAGVNEGIIVMDENMFGQFYSYAKENNAQFAGLLEKIEPYVTNGMTAKEAMNWLLDRDNATKNAILQVVQMLYSTSIDNIVPTSKIVVPVNKENALKYGIVAPEQAQSMVSNVVVNLPNNQLGYKSELMMLDMLANYNWDRSIYFSSGGLYDSTNIFYLNNYLEYDGFSYKFVPIFTEETEEGEMGTINALSMYKQIQNYEWANFNQDKAYFDQTATNNIITYRNAIVRTAEALIKIGEKEKAKELVNLLQEKIPYQRYGEGYALYTLATVYLELGEDKEGAELMAFLKGREQEEMNYYNSLPPREKSTVYNDIQRVKGMQLVSTGNMINYELATKKDTAKAKKIFEQAYLPIETRIKEIAEEAKIKGFENLSESKIDQLSTDLSIQRSMLPLASDIDSVYANNKYKEMVDLINEIDPRMK